MKKVVMRRVNSTHEKMRIPPEKRAFLRQKCQQKDNIEMYEGHLKSSWTHLITLSQNFVEVQ
jgi:hypothetical protein